MLQSVMNNEKNPNIYYGSSLPVCPPSSIYQKLATLLTVIVSLQQKIEILKQKICGYSQFSPELYFEQIDRSDKGYIDIEDFITFIKKTKPTFNIDHRYLKSLFVKLNQDDKVPVERLTYFGYLNIMKPYFNNQYAKDILMRDTVVAGKQINLITKKLLEDLVCTMYVCIAEHQRIKQLMILGDIEQGGIDNGTLYNIYQILQIIKKGAQPKPNPESRTILLLPQTKTRVITEANLSSQRRQFHPQFPDIKSGSSRLSFGNQQKQGILEIFYNFINNNSQYQITRKQMKYLLAYLMCHQYMITNQKYLTRLFMPTSANIEKPNFYNLDSVNAYKQALHRMNKNANYQTINTNNIIMNNVIYERGNVVTQENNFLSFVHPNSVSKDQLIKIKVSAPNERVNKSTVVNQSRNIPPKQPIKKEVEVQNKYIDHSPRILINANQSSIYTPMLQKFLHQSKILKNMSRQYPPSVQEHQSIQQSSAFTIGQQNDIAKEHLQQPVKQDFNFQQSSLYRSEYSQNLTVRPYTKDKKLFNQYRDVELENEGTSILNNFLKK